MGRCRRPHDSFLTTYEPSCLKLVARRPQFVVLHLGSEIILELRQALSDMDGRLGAALATVSSYSTGAHALYESMGFTDVDILEPWIREW